MDAQQRHKYMNIDNEVHRHRESKTAVCDVSEIFSQSSGLISIRRRDEGNKDIRCELCSLGLVPFVFTSLSVCPPDERPINLRVVSQTMQEGDLPLGKQLANELKRHHNHNSNNNNNADESKTPAAGV